MPTAARISIMTGAGIIAAALVGFAMVATNPLVIGPVGVTIWFVALFVAISGLVGAGLLFITGKLQDNIPASKRVVPAQRRGILLGIWVVVLLGLSSLNQLGWRDVGLTALLVVIIEFYFRMKA